MKKALLYFLIITLSSSCNSTRNKIMNSGSLSRTNFITEIPFNFEYGLPIIKVEINQIEYNFLLDTGAPTVLSPELYTTLNLDRLTKSKVLDSQGNEKEEDFVLIESIKINDIYFKNIGAVVSDFNRTFEVKCLNLDGIIGANLMSLAIWEIDYSTQMIRFTNSRNTLHINEDSYVLNFKPKRNQGTPKVDIFINQKKAKRITFDTGSNSDFSMNLSEFKDVITSSKNIESFGNSSTGVYGKGADRISVWSKVNSLKLGTLNLQNQILEFEENASRTIGNKFLQNFKVVIDWNLNQINLSKIRDYANSQLLTFGFNYKVLNKKLYVGTIYKDSEAEKRGMQIDDEILSINELKFSDLSEIYLCDLTFNNITKENSDLKIEILRKGEKFIFNLQKELLLK